MSCVCGGKCEVVVMVCIDCNKWGRGSYAVEAREKDECIRRGHAVIVSHGAELAPRLP